MAATKLPDGINLGFGNRLAGLITWTGPASYSQISTGSPPTGGQSIPATAFGLKFLDGIVLLGLDNTGAYGVEATVINPGKATSALLLWFVAHTGAEVSGATNLSGSSVTLMGIGR